MNRIRNSIQILEEQAVGSGTLTFVPILSILSSCPTAFPFAESRRGGGKWTGLLDEQDSEFDSSAGGTSRWLRVPNFRANPVHPVILSNGLSVRRKQTRG